MLSNLKFNAYRQKIPNLIFFNTMARAMYDYTKAVLSKVSFDVNLFCKELEKALKRLLPHEIEELRIWVNQLIAEKPQLGQCLIYLK